MTPTISPTSRFLFTLSKLRGIGPATLDKIAQQIELGTHTIDDLAKSNKKLQRALEAPNALSKAETDAEIDLEQASAHDARIVCALDLDYPRLLASTSDRPFFIYVKGTMHATPNKSVAVIGTRHPTEHGKITCERLTNLFCENSWSIVSGLALGLDASAHNTAIAAKGHTVAVLAHGLQTIAPKQHERLAQEIIEAGGALVTEYGFGTEAMPHQFVKRDRIQAGLSRAVIMVQSDVDGGSLHASRAAIEYGRHLIFPVATSRDRDKKEPKIGANLVLASGDSLAITALLRCKPEALSRLVPISSRSDYPALLDLLSEADKGVQSDQGTLLD